MSNRQVKKPIPFDFVLEQLETLSPVTKPMFGCTAVYVGEKIVLILRKRSEEPEANGVWLATTYDHHQSLRKDFPIMQSIGVLSAESTGWQILPANEPGFEASIFKACELILSGDTRIGKIPKRRIIKPLMSQRPRTRKEIRGHTSKKRRGSNRDDD